MLIALQGFAISKATEFPPKRGGFPAGGRTYARTIGTRLGRIDPALSLLPPAQPRPRPAGMQMDARQVAPLDVALVFGF